MQRIFILDNSEPETKGNSIHQHIRKKLIHIRVPRFHFLCYTKIITEIGLIAPCNPLQQTEDSALEKETEFAVWHSFVILISKSLFGDLVIQLPAAVY